jgi:tight adherence protein B
MRERIRIRGEIKTLTSQQMLTGIVIGAMPIGLVMIFQVTNPQYMRPLYHEPIGILMLCGAAVLETFGILLIRKILDIEV